METKIKPFKNLGLFFLLSILSVLFIAPIIIVLINSFKGQFYISDAPFSLPNALTFAGTENYLNGIERTNFFTAFFYSLFITVGSVPLAPQ